MIITKRKPVSVGEMLIEEFMEPLAVTQGQLANDGGQPPNDQRNLQQQTVRYGGHGFDVCQSIW